jgi:hypothetical protein
MGYRLKTARAERRMWREIKARGVTRKEGVK